MIDADTTNTADVTPGTQPPLRTKNSSVAPSASTIWLDGLWFNNAGTVQLLGLCPLLAVSNSVNNAFVLGLATLLTLLVSNVLVSLLKHHLQPQTRILFYVLIIATAVTVVDIMLQALTPVIHDTLGLFIPLIVTNCMIIARAEVFASRQPVGAAMVDALATGTGFLLLLCIVGGLREFAGSLGLLIAALPPGAFFALAIVLVCKNLIDN